MVIYWAQLCCLIHLFVFGESFILCCIFDDDFNLAFKCYFGMK